MSRTTKEDGPRITDYTKIPRDDPDQLIEILQAKLGGEGVVIQRGEEVEGRLDLRRPSGIVGLDLACGGGLPAGGLSQIDGADGVGKNLLLNYYFAMNQRIHGDGSNLGMLCLEFNYDKMFGRACGVLVALSKYEIDAEGRRRRMAGEPELTEEEIKALSSQVGKFHILRGAAAERLLEGVVECIKINSYQIIGIDSWDAMLTVADEEKDLEDSAKVADPANVQTRWMRKVFGALTPQKICPICFDRPLTFKRYGEDNYSYECPNSDCTWKGKKPYMWENETSIIGIRQVRANLSRVTMRSREFKVGGAYALRHGKMIDIQLRRGENLVEKDKKIGKEIFWEITKGKCGTHEGATGGYNYFYDPPEIDVTSDLINYCTMHDVIKFGGPKVGYVFQPMEKEKVNLGQKEQMIRRLQDDRTVQNLLRTALYRQLGLGHVRFKDAK